MSWGSNKGAVFVVCCQFQIAIFLWGEKDIQVFCFWNYLQEYFINTYSQSLLMCSLLEL